MAPNDDKSGTGSDGGSSTALPPIPLLIFHPLTPSVEQALPFIFSGEVPYQLSVLELTVESLDLAEDHSPSISLFSVMDEEIRERIRDMMKTRNEERLKSGKPKLDPLVRVVLVSEEKKGMVLDRWQELGAHEVMLAPILSRALLGKLERHYRKLLEVEKLEQKEAEREGRAAQRARDREQRLKAARAKAAKKPKFVIHGKALGPNTFLFPSDDEEGSTSDETVIPHRTVVSIVVDASVLPPGEGMWVRSPGYADDADGEAVWDWVVGNVGVLAGKEGTDDFDKKKIKYRFFGLKPTFDETKKAWVFMGRAPKLYGPFKIDDEADDEESISYSRGARRQGNDLEKAENMAFCASPGNGVFFFKNQVEAKKTEVSYYTEEQWEKTPWNNKVGADEKPADWKDRRTPDEEKEGMRDRRGPSEKAATKTRKGTVTEENDVNDTKTNKPDAIQETTGRSSEKKGEGDLDSALLRALKDARRGAK